MGRDRPHSGHGGEATFKQSFANLRLYLEQKKNIVPGMRSEVQRARQFRSAMSEPEAMLWSRLKRLRERGFHVRRQAPVRGYYLDFVCYTRRLAIEVDGSQHGDEMQSEHDAVRDRIFERQGFRVMRISSGDIRCDLTSVMDGIVLALEATPSTRPSLNAEGRAA
jgi:very-short-patch-repair endonuclease